MSKFILAAIDIAHAETVESVLKKAASLSKLEDANLAVVTVVPDFGMSIVGSFFKEGTEDGVMQKANEQLHDIVSSSLGADVKVKHIVKHGTAYEGILEAAQDLDTSLIIMGAHRPDLRDYLLGPNAARVVRHAQTSVYVVRD
jgi:universal stress protein F